MNPELQMMFSRRSVRKFEDRHVPKEMIKDLLEAAMAAPSAVAKDPWEFIVVRHRAMRSVVTEGLPNGKMLADAPLGIIVCGDMDKVHGRLESYLLQDCSAAIENMLLAASALGLGACWLGVHPREERMAHIREIFHLPEHIVPVAAVAIGFPAEQPEPRTRYDEKAIHWEQW